MSRFDLALASRLDHFAQDAISGIAEVMITAASRLRQIADLPDHVLPPPPIMPIAIDHVTPAQLGGDTLELRDGIGDGFHDVGAMPAKNARLRKPVVGDAPDELPPRRIFEDPRLQPGYKPKK